VLYHARNADSTLRSCNVDAREVLPGAIQNYYSRKEISIIIGDEFSDFDAIDERANEYIYS